MKDEKKEGKEEKVKNIGSVQNHDVETQENRRKLE